MPQFVCSARQTAVISCCVWARWMANADYIRRKVHELKEQATRLGSDAIDGLRGSRIGGAVAPTFEELRERARR